MMGECGRAQDFDCDPEPDDVILLLKANMSSKACSQNPQVHLPAGYIAQLAFGPVEPLPKNKLSKRECDEYLKTAKRLKADPWHLIHGAKYLETLVADNEKNENNRDNLLDIRVYKSHSRSTCPLLPEAMSEWFNYAPGTPKRINIHNRAPQPPARLRRMRSKRSAPPGHERRVVAPKRAAAAAGIDDIPIGKLGCSKCRWSSKTGCSECRAWAEQRLKGEDAPHPWVRRAAKMRRPAAAAEAAELPDEAAGGGELPEEAAGDELLPEEAAGGELPEEDEIPEAAVEPEEAELPPADDGTDDEASVASTVPGNP